MAPFCQESMPTTHHDIERILTHARGYNALFMAAGALEGACEENPECLTERGVQLLLGTLADDQFTTRRTALFFYRRFAQILTRTAQKLEATHPIAILAIKGIVSLIAESSGDRHLAICSACAPFTPQQTVTPPRPFTDHPTPFTCNALLREAGFPEQLIATPCGRSLRYAHNGRILVIKCARPSENPVDLAREWQWMETLNNGFPQRGHIPTPIGAPLMDIQGLPQGAASTVGIAFLTTPGYFDYPNEPLAPMTTPRAKKVIGQGATLFGDLASQGVFHTAPVPLFHNRVQVDRRDDDGVYLWQKGGRLDRWLASCRYPNFGLSGLRDFEHLATANETKTGEIYRILGNQIFSLLLVAGSHFRSLAGPGGLPPHTPGKDRRSLFDCGELEGIIEAISDGYYRGYTGRSNAFPCRDKNALLARRMIQEMGTNLYMDELLRVRDQAEMNDDDFYQFLMERGYSERQAHSTPRASSDITLLTGPHLGHFNGKISCPELIEFTATLASITMADGFLGKG